MAVPEEGPRPDVARRALAVGAAVVAVAYVAAMLDATGGHAVPQVVDLYLICQYARAIALGHPFQYNPGEAPSTGATSLLFTALLGAADALGLRGERLIAFAIAVGAAAYVLTVQVAFQLAARLAGRREAILAGTLVMLGGPTVWGFLYGSDIGLFMLLFTRLTERLFAGSARGVAVAGTLLALTRPEGLPIALMVALAAPWLWPADRRARGLQWIAVGAGVAVLALYRSLTGYWVSSSVADKSLLGSYTVSDTLGLVASYLVDSLRGVLLGFYPSTASVGFAQGFAPFFFPPLGLVFALLGAVHADRRWPAAVRTWGLITTVIFVLVAPNTFMGVHFNRYEMWIFPTLLAFAAVGLGTVTHLVSDEGGQGDRLFRAGAWLFALLGLLSTARFASLYGQMAGGIQDRDVAAATWISEHLPRGVAIANLATSVEYLTGHRAMNLHGVTSPAFFGNRTVEREAGTFEALGRLPPNERPPYLLTTAATQASLVSMQEMVDGPPLFRTDGVPDDIEIYRLRYDLVDRNRRMFSPEARARVRGLRLVDELNVCDTSSERAHHYRHSSSMGTPLHGTVRVAEYSPDGMGPTRVVDAGRAIVGGETFEITLTPGRDLVVVVRTAAEVAASVMRAGGAGVFTISAAEAGFDVEVGGRPQPRQLFHPGAGWHEHVFTVPGDALSGTKTTLTLRGRYASFYYWFFQ